MHNELFVHIVKHNGKRIDDNIVSTLTGSVFSGAQKFEAGLSGSLTQLVEYVVKRKK